MALDIQSKFRNWAFPTLMAITSWLIMDKLNSLQSDMTSLKADVKSLMGDNASTKTDLRNLKEQVNRNTGKLFGYNSGENPPPAEPRMPGAATLPDNTYELRRKVLLAFLN